MYDGSDTVILFEELAYQDVLPWRGGRCPTRSIPTSPRATPPRTCACCRPHGLAGAGAGREARRELPARRGSSAHRAEDQPAAGRGRPHPRRQPAPPAVRRRSASMRSAPPSRAPRRFRGRAPRAPWRSICASAWPSRCGSSAASPTSRRRRDQGALPAARRSDRRPAREARLPPPPAPVAGSRQSAAHRGAG